MVPLSGFVEATIPLSPNTLTVGSEVLQAGQFTFASPFVGSLIKAVHASCRAALTSNSNGVLLPLKFEWLPNSSGSSAIIGQLWIILGVEDLIYKYDTRLAMVSWRYC